MLQYENGLKKYEINLKIIIKKPCQKLKLLNESLTRYNIMLKKRNKVRIWTIVEKWTAKIIDFELGDRTHKTLENLFDRWKNNNESIYYSDNWDAYKKVVPNEQLYI